MGQPFTFQSQNWANPPLVKTSFFISVTEAFLIYFSSLVCLREGRVKAGCFKYFDLEKIFQKAKQIETLRRKTNNKQVLKI